MGKIQLGVIYGIIFAVLIAGFAAAQGLEPLREQRLKYGPSLYITNVHTHPEGIEPGADAILSLDMENVADYSLRDVIINLELPSQFAPRGISKEKIRSIGALEKVEQNFSIVALPNSKEGVYEVPFTVNYIDEIGTPYYENNTISLKISTEPRIFIELTSSDLYDTNPLGNINIKIANTGVGDLKFLVAELLPSSQYEIIGTSKDYIGSLNSDDYETVDFKIKALDINNPIKLNLKMDFTDSNNKAYTKTSEIPLKILSAQNAGIKQNNNLFIFIAIGLLILYFVYRQIRKRSKKR